MAQKEQKQKMLPKNFRFIQDFLGHCTMVPDLLLEEYQQLGLTERELVLLLRVMKANSSWGCFVQEDICREFAVSPAEAQGIINIFLDKGFIAMTEEEGEAHYNLDGLFQEMWEIWFYKKSCQRGEDEQLVSSAQTKEERQLAQLHRTFAQELGRTLSPIENEKLSAWLFEDGFAEELIMEALSRAVFQGKLTFSYMDSILLSWRQQNLRTLAEVKTGDRHPAAKQLPKSAAKPGAAVAPDEYNRIYDKIIIKKQ